MDEFTLSVEDALARLDIIEDYDPGDGPQPCVHTVRDAGFGLLGAHWSVANARKLMEKHGVSESGPQAQAGNHGVAVIDEDGPLFFATKP
jgi:hypothetical protein